MKIDWTEEGALEMLRDRYEIHPDHTAISSRVPMSVVVALCDRVEELTAQRNALVQDNAEAMQKLHGGYSEEE